jgi:hypothetical protein
MAHSSPVETAGVASPSSRLSLSPLFRLVGFSIILVSIINIWQAQRADSWYTSNSGGGDLTAIHAAVREFVKHNPNFAKKKKKTVSSGEVKVDSKLSSKLQSQSNETTTYTGNAARNEEASLQMTPPARYPPLNCDRFGGPSAQVAQELVYWQDIPSDTRYVSPFTDASPKYMTFEPDGGGT